jgi:hypothetical protein
LWVGEGDGGGLNIRPALTCPTGPLAKMCQPSRRFSRKYSRHGFTSDGSSKPLTAYSWGSPVLDSCVEIAMIGCRVARLRSCSTSSRSDAERCVHGVMETCRAFQLYRAWTQPLTISPAQAVVMIAAPGSRIDLTRIRPSYSAIKGGTIRSNPVVCWGNGLGILHRSSRIRQRRFKQGVGAEDRHSFEITPGSSRETGRTLLESVCASNFSSITLLSP